MSKEHAVDRVQLLLVFLDYYEQYYGREYAGDTNYLSNETLMRDIEKLEIMLDK